VEVWLQFRDWSMTGTFQPSASTKKEVVADWVFAVGVSLLVSFLVVLPFFWLGSASGHDFEFHVASWLDVSYQWKEGVFYPRWTAWTNHGFGEPRYIFYPPLSWMLGAALTRVVALPWVPMIFVLLTQTLAGFNAFCLLRRLTGRRGALFGAACYAANPNALLMTYVRSDFAEQLACAIFPLLLLGTLKVTRLLEDEARDGRAILSLAMPFAAVWLCNAPAGVIATYAVALLIGWTVVSQRSWSVAVWGAAGLALGFGLTSFYLIPAAYEQRWVNISQALSTGLLPWENFLFTRIADVEHTWFNYIASFSAVVLMLLLGGSALLSRTLTGNQKLTNGLREVWKALLVLGAGASLLVLRWSKLLWEHLPKLRFVQFPWRWMSIVALVYVCFLAVVAQKRRGWLVPVCILLLSVPLANFFIENGWWDPDEMPTQQDAIVNGNGYDGTDEYDPVGDDHVDLPVKAPQVRVLSEASGGEPVKDADVQVLHWKTEQKEIRVRVKDKASAVLRVLNYPAWRIEVNGKRVTPERLDDVNVMVIPVEGGESDIRVWFGRTKDRVVGNWVSGFSLGVCGVIFYFGKKKRVAQS
jgi:hypothetical protein